MAGVVKLFDPLNNNVPPVDASYQSIVFPADVDADMVTVPAPHLEPLTGLVGVEGFALTVAVTRVLGVEIQPVVVFLATA
jgi:hypothetical protein